MSKMGEKFTEEKAREYEDRGANRSDDLAELLTIGEMTLIIAAVTSALDRNLADTTGMLNLRRLMWDARTQAEINEYAGDYDYPEDAS